VVFIYVDLPGVVKTSAVMGTGEIVEWDGYQNPAKVEDAREFC